MIGFPRQLFLVTLSNLNKPYAMQILGSSQLENSTLIAAILSQS